MFAFICAISVIYIAVKANLDRASQPVEGSSQEQQKKADDFRAALAKDSTSVEARIGLANILYDTGNWSEAVIHYRATIKRDSSRTSALVDLGVCYYNLGHPDEAEELFLLALRHDPHQPVALYNLGIVSERRSDLDAALRYFHGALQSGPPEEMKPAIIEALQRVQKATGRQAPPLPDGR
jgi:tetratricopeptide (TPR) repeat protein